MWYDFVGFSGGLILAVSSIPQVYYCVREGDTKSLSVLTLLFVNVGLLLNIVYAAVTKQYIYLTPMCLSFILNMALLALKIIFDKPFQKNIESIELLPHLSRSNKTEISSKE